MAKEYVFEGDVPYHYLGGRWHNPKNLIDNQSGWLQMKEQLPAVPSLTTVAAMMENARNGFCSHPGLLQMERGFVKSHDYHFLQDFHLTMFESSRFTVHLNFVSVGHSSWTLLSQIFNQDGKFVGFTILTAVNVMNDRPAKISPDNPVRNEVRPDLYHRFCKNVKRPSFASSSSRRCDFSYAAVVRPGDMDMWMHVNQSVYLGYAMDALDAALVAKNVSADLHWIKKVRLGPIESSHNIKWKRVFIQYDSQVKYGDTVEVRIWSSRDREEEEEDSLEFRVVKILPNSQEIAASRVQCWFPVFAQAKM
eukprot:TRINITY_DN14913_c0_g1_i1.p1 TRINITY_DN14913_c0_g1~~TRINITY_DN14913_c0_g1_i1.p1  ORF type:complete len:307 (-),score=65.95 TRINITY_DN14913_c0_g1_i1:991-1911(-)